MFGSAQPTFSFGAPQPAFGSFGAPGASFGGPAYGGHGQFGYGGMAAVPMLPARTPGAAPSTAEGPSQPRVSDQDLLQLSVDQLLDSEFMCQNDLASSEAADASDEGSNESLQQQAVEEAAKEYASAGLAEYSAAEGKKALARLSRELTALSTASNAAFPALLDNRVLTLKRLYRVYESHHKIVRSGTSMVTPAQPKTLSPLLHLGVTSGVMVLTSLLDDAFVNKPQICMSLLDQLLHLVQSVGSLTVPPVPGAIEEVCLTGLDKLTKLLYAHVMSGKLLPELQVKALELLVVLSITRQRLSDVLAVVDCLLHHAPADAELMVGSAVSTLIKSMQSVSLTLATVPKRRGKSWRLPTLTGTPTAFAADEEYLYVVHGTTLTKVGSGAQSSSPGVVYGTISLPAVPLYALTPGAFGAPMVFTYSTETMAQLAALPAEESVEWMSALTQTADVEERYVTDSAPTATPNTPRAPGLAQPGMFPPGGFSQPPMFAEDGSDEEYEEFEPNFNFGGGNEFGGGFINNFGHAAALPAGLMAAQPAPPAVTTPLDRASVRMSQVASDGQFLFVVGANSAAATQAATAAAAAAAAATSDAATGGASESKEPSVADTQFAPWALTLHVVDATNNFTPVAQLPLGYKVGVTAGFGAMSWSSEDTVIGGWSKRNKSESKKGGPMPARTGGLFGGGPQPQTPLDPAAAFVVVDHSPQFAGVQSRTMELWVKMPDVGRSPDNQACIIASHWEDNRNHVTLYSQGPNMVFSVASASFGNCDLRFNMVNADQWMHVAATVSTTGAMSLFVNGSQVASSVCNGPPQLSSGARLWLGYVLNENSSSFKPFKGQLAEFRFWRVARTEEQIRAGMSRCFVGDTDDEMSNLIGNWRLAESVGGAALDYTAWGNHGRVVGFEWNPSSDRPAIQDEPAEPIFMPAYHSPAQMAQCVTYTNGEAIGIFFRNVKPQSFVPLASTLGTFQVFSCHDGTLLREYLVNESIAVSRHVCPVPLSAPKYFMWTLQTDESGVSAAQVVTSRPLSMPSWHTGQTTSSGESLEERVQAQITEGRARTSSKGTETPLSTVGALVQFVEARAVRAKAERGADSQGSQPRAGRGGSSAVPANLCKPMAVELSAEAMTLIFNLLTRLGAGYTQGSLTPLQHYALLVVVRVLECNLQHMISWNVKPSVLGLDADVTTSNAPKAAAFVELLNALLEVNSSTPVGALVQPSLRQSICDVLSVGMPVFCSTADMQLSVLSSLVGRQLADSSAGDTKSSNDAELRQMLITRYFENMVLPKSVVALLAVLESRDSVSSSAAMLDKLLDQSLTLVMQYTESAVLSNLHNTQDGANTVSVPPHIVAVREFLVRIQTLMLVRVLCHRKPTADMFDEVCTYAQRVTVACAELLRFCAREGGWPEEATTEPGILSVKARVVSILKQAVGAVMQSLFASLWALPLSTRLATQLAPALNSLMVATDRLARDLPEVVAAEADDGQQTTKWIITKRAIVAESQHPVRQQGTVERFVRIPGAEQVSVDFDVQSFSNSGSGESIGLFRGAGHSRPVHVNITSPGPWVIPGDCVYVVYNTGFNNRGYGFKCSVRGEVKQQAVMLPWLLDLEKCIGCMAARCASVLVRGVDEVAVSIQAARAAAEAASAAQGRSVRTAAAAASSGAADAKAADVDPAVQTWLQCELVRNGLQISNADEDLQQIQELQSLWSSFGLTRDGHLPVAGAGDSMDTLDSLLPLVEDLKARLADVEVDKFKLSSKAANHTKSAIRAVIVALLVHNHLVDAARDFIATTAAEPTNDAPAAIVRVWKTAHRIKRWLRSRWQTAILAASQKEKEKEKASADSKDDSASPVEVDSKDAADKEDEAEGIDRTSMLQDICDEVVACCKLLVQVTPVPLPAARGPPALVRASSSMSEAHKSSGESKARDAISTLAAWQSTQETDVPLADANSEQRLTIVWRHMLTLFGVSQVLPKVRAAMLSRRSLARLRVVGFHCLRKLLSHTQSGAVKREIIGQVFSAMSESSRAARQGRAPSYDHGLEACGVDMEESVLASFEALYMALLQVLSSPTVTSAQLLLATLHAFALEYSVRSYTSVVSLGVYESLKSLLSRPTVLSVTSAPAGAAAPAAFGKPFGAAAVAAVGSFGAAPSGSPFGAASSGSPFGAAPTGSPFGAAPTGSPFGAAPSGSPFGAAPTGSPFGAAPAGTGIVLQPGGAGFVFQSAAKAAPAADSAAESRATLMETVQTGAWAVLDLLSTTWVRLSERQGASSIGADDALSPVFDILFDQLNTIGAKLLESPFKPSSALSAGKPAPANKFAELMGRANAASQPSVGGGVNFSTLATSPLMPTGPAPAMTQVPMGAAAAKVGAVSVFGIQSAATGANAILSPALSDALTIKVLSVLLKLAQLPSGRRRILRTNVMRSLLLVLTFGSPRSRLVVGRVLGRILPDDSLHSVDLLDSVVPTVLQGSWPRLPTIAVPGQAGVWMMLSYIGRALVSPILSTFNANKVLLARRRADLGPVFADIQGDCHMTSDGVCSWPGMVALVRSLARQSAQWREAISTLLEQQLAGVPRLMERLEQARHATCASPDAELDMLLSDGLLNAIIVAAGALAVAGGFVASLCVGSSVRQLAGDFQGVVVSMVGDKVSVVVGGEGSTDISTANKTDLELLPHEPFNPKLFAGVTGGLQALTVVRAAVSSARLLQQIVSGKASVPSTPHLLLLHVCAAAMRALQANASSRDVVYSLVSSGGMPADILALAGTASHLNESTCELEHRDMLTRQLLGKYLVVAKDVTLQITPASGGKVAIGTDTLGFECPLLGARVGTDPLPTPATALATPSAATAAQPATPAAAAAAVTSFGGQAFGAAQAAPTAAFGGATTAAAATPSFSFGARPAAAAAAATGGLFGAAAAARPHPDESKSAAFESKASADESKQASASSASSIRPVAGGGFSFGVKMNTSSDVPPPAGTLHGRVSYVPLMAELSPDDITDKLVLMDALNTTSSYLDRIKAIAAMQPKAIIVTIHDVSAWKALKLPEAEMKSALPLVSFGGGGGVGAPTQPDAAMEADDDNDDDDEALAAKARRAAPEDSFVAVNVPVVCIGVISGASIRTSLGVGADDDPTTQQRRSLTKALMALGYSSNLIEKALSRSMDLEAATAWLEQNADWLENQSNMMAELDQAVALSAELEEEERKAEKAAMGAGGPAAAVAAAPMHARSVDSDDDEDAFALDPRFAPAAASAGAGAKAAAPAAADSAVDASAEFTSIGVLVAQEKTWTLGKSWQRFRSVTTVDTAQATTASGQSLWANSTVLRSMATMGMSDLLTMQASLLQGLGIHYARRTLVTAFCVWPFGNSASARPITELVSGETLPSALHLGLSVEAFPAAVGVTDDQQPLPAFQAQLRGMIAVEARQAQRGDQTVGVVVTSMLSDCQRVLSSAVPAPVLASNPRPIAVLAPLTDLHTLMSRGFTAPAVTGMRICVTPTRLAQFPHGYTIRIFQTADRTNMLHQITGQNMTSEFRVSGDTIYLDVCDQNMNPVNAFQFNRGPGYKASADPNAFTLDVHPDSGAAHAQSVGGDVSSSLNTLVLLLDSDCMSAVRGGAGVPAPASLYVPGVLLSLLQALPGVADSATAEKACRVAARLFRRWAATVVDGSEGFALTAEQRTTRQELAALFIKLQLAQSWLRTMVMSTWNNEGSLPSYLQALMELLLAAKKSLGALGLLPSPAAIVALVGGNQPELQVASVGGDDGEAPSVTPEELEKAYLDGREGPVLCSVLHLTSKQILASNVINVENQDGSQRTSMFGGGHSMNSGVSLYAADVIVRRGKWYFEILVEADMAGGGYRQQLQFGAGWVTPKFPMNQTPGSDPTGQSWLMYMSPNANYTHRGQSSNTTRSARSMAGPAGGAKPAKAEKMLAKKKMMGGKDESAGERQVVGCMLDLDAGTMTFVLNGDMQTPAFTDLDCPDGMVPYFITSNHNNCPMTAVMNLGRLPWTHAPPAGYCPLEAPWCAASSWLSRFEHSADLTRRVFANQPLPASAIDSAFAAEVGAGGGREIPLEPAKVAGGNVPLAQLEGVLRDDGSCVQFNQNSFGAVSLPIMAFRVAGQDNPKAFVSSVSLRMRNQSAVGLVFVCNSLPDFEVFSWCENFTEQHFTAFQKRQASKGGDPKPHEPVAYFKCRNTITSTVSLAKPQLCSYVVIKFLQENTGGFGGHQSLCVEYVKCSGMMGGHPLAPYVGTPAFDTQAAELVSQLKRMSDGSQWNNARDCALTALVQTVTTRMGVQPTSLDAMMFQPTQDDLMRFKALGGLTVPQLQARFAVIKFLNRLVTPLLNYVDVTEAGQDSADAGQTESKREAGAASGGKVAEDGSDQFLDSELSLSIIVHRMRGLYFTNTKLSVLEALLGMAMQQQANFGGRNNANMRVSLNRHKAMKARERPEEEGSFQESCFAQIFNAVRSRGNTYSRFGTANRHEQLWNVDFIGEGSIDVGGPYRESLVLLCQDLMSTVTPLFKPCPNRANDTGLNREKFLPNPSATSESHMNMFEFVGALMAAAMRTKFTLPLDLPSIVWKQLLGEAVDESDLEAVDKLCFQALDGLLTLSEDELAELKQPFTTHLSSGQLVELVPGGAFKYVNHANVREFRNLVIQARLQESRLQIRALQKGFSAVVPLQRLSLFNWYEVEVLVCGRPDVDIELLRKHTVFRGTYGKNHPIARHLFRALQSFSQEERQLFLRFVWGRNRLPSHDADWTQPFTVAPLQTGTTSDVTLPVAHTCFFTIDLPLYSSYEVLRAKLLYAIVNCQAIDTDFNPNSSSISTWVD